MRNVFALSILLLCGPVILAHAEGEADKAAVEMQADIPAENVAALENADQAALSPAAESLVAEPEKIQAEEAVEVPVDPNLSFLQLLFKSIGEMKGASALAIAGIVIQLLLKLLDLPIVGSWFSGTKGWVKLLVVSGLTFALAPITLVQAAGLDWGAALVHSSTLAALMVFLNQIYNQFFKKA